MQLVPRQSWGGIGICCLVVLVISAAAVCWKKYSGGGGERSVLSWNDAASGAVFTVTIRPSLIKTNSMLHVQRNGQVRSVVIDDDLQWGKLSFVRYQEWLLVLNGGYVVAGYHYATQEAYGENQWLNLPFTVYRRGGAVLAAKKVGDKAYLPAGFPIVEQADESGRESRQGGKQ